MNDSSSMTSGLDVSRETMDKLRALSDLISKWTKSINLIAPASVGNIWERHIVDSMQVFTHAKPSWTSWTDLGSGGGLPGLVIAILDGGARTVTLVESDTRKCLFLNTARRELGLNVNVINGRIESSEIAQCDVLSARALAPLSDLLHHAENLLSQDGVALFSKGAKFEEELDAANKTWHFDCIPHLSVTNDDARILEISRIHRREP